jgi:hypothetical protein
MTDDVKTITPLSLPTGVPLPALAPLNAPLIAQILHQHVASRSVIDAFRRYPASLAWLFQALGPIRDHVARDLAPLAEPDRLTTGRFLELLRELSPSSARPNTALLSNWRGRGILRMRRHGYLDPQRAAAVLLARRLLPGATRNWLPDEIPPSEPDWWCWRQDGPVSPITTCPVPLPRDLPTSVLLWVPWAGAAWLPDWTPIATGALYYGGIQTPQALVEAAQTWRVPLDASVRIVLEASDNLGANMLTARQLWIHLAAPIVEARWEPILA